ncbi:MAG: Bax inhibitor-1/YccA family protein [Anaerolineae bacterium]|nr:Bax inhibitor-1/YccA family protein [Anaerolineae bacterium]
MNYRSDSQVIGVGVNVSDVMRQVYLWMTGGLLITAFIAFVVAQTDLWTIVANPVVLLVAFLIQLGIVIGISARINKMSPTTAGTLFAVYSATMGFTLSLIFIAYTAADITYALVATASMFAAMSIVGYTTKIDLSKLGAILFMGLIGLILVSILNIFLQSDGLYWAISIAGVVIFTGLTAWDTQKIKQMAGQVSMASMTESSVAVRRLSIIGALILYLDFINLFLFMLRLVGGSRR